jgi:hypothetical protein
MAGKRKQSSHTYVILLYSKTNLRRQEQEQSWVKSNYSSIHGTKREKRDLPFGYLTITIHHEEDQRRDHHTVLAEYLCMLLPSMAIITIPDCRPWRSTSSVTPLLSSTSQSQSQSLSHSHTRNPHAGYDERPILIEWREVAGKKMMGSNLGSSSLCYLLES